MYLSHIHLRNWRSYADAEFRFAPPTPRRRLVLIGAMNGSGKTSLLVSLYLGLFGRHGLRHVEGFAGADVANYYRGAISDFRRHHTPADEPTTVDITFSPTEGEDEQEVRIVRRWFFDAVGKPHQGSRFEQVDLYLGGNPVALAGGEDPERAELERRLFPAEFMPAFFFDGEQAQSLIHESKSAGMKKAVNVIFGTEQVDQTRARVRDWVRAASAAAGGKRTSNERQTRLHQKEIEQDALETQAENLQRDIGQLQRRHGELEAEQRKITSELQRLNGQNVGDLQRAEAEVTAASTDADGSSEQLRQRIGRLGLAMAVSRLSQAVRDQMRAEELREEWLSVKRQTVEQTDAVLAHALPQPAEADPLLGHLAPHLWQKVRARFEEAVQLIYNPPPMECAPDYTFGFATGKARQRLGRTLDEAGGAGDVRSVADRVRAARERLGEARLRRQKIADLPAEAFHHKERLEAIDAERADVSRRLGAAENEREGARGRLAAVNKEVGEFREEIAKLAPEQRRLAVAERVTRALDELGEELQPLALAKLRGLITRHFTAIADPRFAEGEVVFVEGETPVLRREGFADQRIDGMSGFERRSFGVAFSLALAEITHRRLPLVIDTPLGNADTEYRRRLLDALAGVELDQIVLLPHDAEVPPDLADSLGGAVRQRFLVEYDAGRRESVVRPDQYFQGDGQSNGDGRA